MRAIFLLTMLSIVLPVRGAVIDVYVYNNQFSIHHPDMNMPVTPATISVGDSIRWIWLQGNHTTTSVAGSAEVWDQPINSGNQEFFYQFNTAGVYWYYCIPHGSDNGDGTASGMSSTVTVLSEGSAACCLPDGNCIVTTEGDCVSQSGTFDQSGSLCSDVTCEVNIAVAANKDNILYYSENGSLSNGMGQYLYVGDNNSGHRRTIVAFDLSAIPVNAVIVGVQLMLYCNSASGAGVPVTAQRLLKDWGEGASDAPGNEGNGTQAASGDATWVHTFYDTATWDSPGGDFATTISATTTVSGSELYYTWSSPQLTEDVTDWLHEPDANFGWIIRGDENSTANTKRFSSRQNGDQNQHPLLVIEYLVPPTGACCLPDGSCEVLSATQCMMAGGMYQGTGSSCEETTCSVVLMPFLDPLPLPAVAQPVSGSPGGEAHYTISMTEQFQQLHSALPPTRVWGYNGTYPGPTIEAFRNAPVTVRWVNDLREYETNTLRETHALHVDTCLHGPHSTGSVPVTVVHLHGGKVPADSDGYPEDTFAPGDSSDLYHYPNIQPAGTLWYHDHALGITRLNVMMGLAGLYYLRDEHELALNLPSGEFEIPLVIQDRAFNADGSIQYPKLWHEHFFGNTILVNGKVWPYLHVKQGKYRFRIVNGSNSRTYTLKLSDGASFTQIGSELGLFYLPVILDSLTVLPGERYDLVIDFSFYAPETEILLMNSAPAPFPGFPGVGVIPDVLKFIVTGMPGHIDPLPDTLVMVEKLLEENADQERIFELITIGGAECGGHHHALWTINGLHWDDITEYPVLGSTEIWTWHNTSGISHPMHMHLVAFQVLDRQVIDDVTGEPAGELLPPEDYEKGWKDTVHSPPGFRTRVITRFEGFTGLFPYHCHILEHEDHEMMRQFDVQPCLRVSHTADAGPGSLRFAIACAQPGDTVYFAQDLANDTIFLLSNLVIDKDISIAFQHPGTVVINGQQTDQLLQIAQDAHVMLSTLDLIAGNGTSGRAIVNYGHLMMDQITIYDHPMAQTGHAILNVGSMSINNTCKILFLQ